MIEFVPIKQLPERIAKGWQMVPNYLPAKGDYACLTTPPVKQASNLSRAATIRNLDASKRRAELEPA